MDKLNFFVLFLILGAVVVGIYTGIIPTGNQPSSSPSSISDVASDIKGLVKMGTDGMNEVHGNGNDEYLRDFASGKGVSEMIR